MLVENPGSFTQAALEAVAAHNIVNPATGTFATNIVNTNDNNIATNSVATVVGQYAIIDFGRVLRIRKSRMCGHNNNNGDGSFRVDYYDLVVHAWTTWCVVPTRTGATWSEVIQTEQLTDKIRLTLLVDDTKGFNSNVGEFHAIY